MLDLNTDQDRELSLVELAVGQWIYWMKFADTYSDTYQNILLPLDLTKEAEQILPEADKLLRSEGEGILLYVLPPNSDLSKTGDPVPRQGQRDHCDRGQAMEYLKELASRFGADTGRWRCEVIEAPSIVEGVVNYADREGVDIIVMNEQQRKGLARLTKRSIAKQIKQKVPMDVRIFRSG